MFIWYMILAMAEGFERVGFQAEGKLVNGLRKLANSYYMWRRYHV